MTTSSQHTSSQGLSIAAMVLGIVTIVLSFWWIFAFITGTLAIIFGAVSLKSAGRRKALAGIITGIAGILLATLFIVLLIVGIPALQKAQRDNLRKSDVTSIMNDIAGYRANNNGSLPTVTDLATVSLSGVSRVNDSGEPTVNLAVYRPGVSCDGSTANKRSYSVRVLLENGSVYCQDS